MDLYGLARKITIVMPEETENMNGWKSIDIKPPVLTEDANSCVVCGEEPKLFGEFGKKCTEKYEIFDEAAYKLSYPVILKIGYALLDTLGDKMRNYESKPVEKWEQLHAISIAPLLGFVPTTKFMYFHRLMNSVKDIEGDIVECGVGWGESLLHMSVIASVEQPTRRLWGIDSFEGWPAPTKEDDSPRATVKGDTYSEERMGVSPLKMLRDTFGWFGIPKAWLATHVTLIQGWFDRCLGLYTGDKIALLHLDCDLHNSYKLCLEAFYPKVSVGGAIAVDEYANSFENYYFPGARKAIDEYMADKYVRRMRDPFNGKYYFVKEAQQ